MVFQRVTSLLENKQYDTAAKTLDRFRSCPAHSQLETFQMGWLYGRARRFDTALQIFGTVARDVPDPLTHDYAVALSKFELADYQGAIEILEQRGSTGSADAKSVNLLAVSYSKLGQYRQAYDILAREAQKDSSDLSLYLNLITVCAEAGDFGKAEEVATEAQRLFPNSADVFIVQGAADTLLGHLDQAHNHFATGARLAPSRADARFFLALIDYKQGKFPEAISVLRTALKDGMADSELHYLLAECLLKLGSNSTDAAIHELNRAIDLNANSVSARTLRGKLLLDSGHPYDALRDLEFASRQDPDSRSVLYNLARAYRAVGRNSEAQDLFRQVRAQSTDTVNEFSRMRLNEALSGKSEQQR
jgi:tetratricopeptide (TPR) repeat protein